MSAITTDSTVLVDAAALTRSLGCVHRDFTILEFLDLCTVIEAIVLNDRLTVLDSSPELIRGHEEMGILHAQGMFDFAASGVEPAAEAPVLGTFRARISALTDAGHLPRTPLGKTSFGEAFREAGVIAEAERRLQVSALPLRRFAGFYAPKVLAREEHTACDLAANYEILSRDLRRGRGLYRYPLAEYVVAEIPPMPVLALRRARSRDRLLDAALELREEYASLRASLSRLRAALRDDEVSPREKRRQLRSWARSWKTLDRYGPPARLSLAATTLSAMDVDRSVDGTHLDLRRDSLLGMVLRSAREEWYRWRVRILHDAARQYLETSDGSIVRETERLFGHRLSADDLRELNDWDGQMASLAEPPAAESGSTGRPRQPPANEERAAVLFLAADPQDLARLRLGLEARKVDEVLRLGDGRRRWTLQLRTAVRPQDLTQALLEVEPRILHLSGHGAASGDLYLENDAGETERISADALGDVLGVLKGVECVVMNACHSAARAEAVARHVPYVIGMTQAIGDGAAIAFSIGFYQAVAAGRPIPEAHRLGCAQVRMTREGEHATPVLVTGPTAGAP